MILLSLKALLIIIGWIAYAAMYTIQFHFSESIFSNWNKNFWDPEVSDKNKWKLDDQGNIIEVNGKKVPKFIGSSTFLVFTTDGFHLMQFIFLNCIITALAINVYFFAWYIDFVMIRILYAVEFNPFFNKLLILKKYESNKNALVKN